jgi:hypothetical protein
MLQLSQISDSMASFLLINASHFPQSELIAHMDKESADARESLGK